MLTRPQRALLWFWFPFSRSILYIFRLIYKPQVKGSKREDFYPNTPTQEQFNLYFIK